jgi:pseudaminic acid biosynthesis-associated methylase
MLNEQENFWRGEFGTDYISRNNDDALLASKIAMWSRILSRARDIKSVRELGANVGLNLRAISSLVPNVGLEAVEINEAAYAKLVKVPGVHAVRGTLLDEFPADPVDLTFTCGVLIHQNPAVLETAYSRLYEGSSRYIVVCEYYSPAPVEVPYRGHSQKLFKRDFCGELLDLYSDLRLVDYGFLYRRDPMFPADDATWFLIEKQS